MASTFRLKDNSRAGEPADPAFAKSALFAKLHGKTPRELSESERVFAFPPSSAIAAEAGDEEMVLWGSPESLKTGNLMGFFGCDGEELIIGSRFTSDDEGDWFLHRMLGKVLGFSAVDMKLGIDSESQRYALLELLFPEYFRRALLKGPYKTYVRRSFNDSHVRGQIDVPRFIREDRPFSGRIAYNTREYTENNDVMHLVRHAIEAISRGGTSARSHVASMLAKDRELCQLAETVRNATPDYHPKSRAKVLAANVKSPLRSRYHRAYMDLQRLCVALLMGREVSPRGEKGKVHGMLFDGAWLWEEYLNCLFDEAGLCVAHPKNREKRGGHHLFQTEKSLAGLIYPDFVAEGISGRVIMDAKYKRVTGVRGSDYHQLLSYMFRFESSRGFFLYPEAGHEEPKEYMLLSGIHQSEKPRKDPGVVVVKLGLPIPQGCRSEEEFSELMRQAESGLVKNVGAALSG